MFIKLQLGLNLTYEIENTELGKGWRKGSQRERERTTSGHIRRLPTKSQYLISLFLAALLGRSCE
jgi:hypothetical protein